MKVNTEAAIAIGLAYKRGEINLDQAVQRLVSATGLSKTIAEQMFRSLKRTNVIEFHDKK